MSLLDSNFEGRSRSRRKLLKAIRQPALAAEGAPRLVSTAEIVAFPTAANVAPPVIQRPVIQLPAPAAPAYAALGKRLFDIAAVVLSAVIWLPVILICALLVALDGGNPFYTQERVGRNGRTFRMIKLRSMVTNADALLEDYLSENPEARREWDTTQKLKNDPRITRVGKFIRKSSIDELPQLINVLIGDMSLVGPRPFMTCQSDLYDGQAYYCLRPGLTGFWQVSDRNEGSFKGRVDFDEAYLKDMSLRTDLRVLTQTVGVVVRATGY